jgi:hypothetical protein
MKRLLCLGASLHHRYFRCIFSSLLFASMINLTWVTASTAEVVSIRHYQKQERYAFGLKLLDLAMSKTGVAFEVIGPENENITEARGELEVIEGRLDLQFLSTNVYRESRMIPVKIPVYRGLLGLRLLLIRPGRQDEFARITTVADLSKYAGLHGTHWGDLPVYAANHLPVVTSVKYESLFDMLIQKRGDYFHRGVSEIWPELGRYGGELVIADQIALFYPHPVYFFVGNHRPELARLLEKGLQNALADGSFKELFLQEYQSVIDKAELDKRRIIVLTNPVAPEDAPVIDTSWWMPAAKE